MVFLPVPESPAYGSGDDIVSSVRQTPSALAAIALTIGAGGFLAACNTGSFSDGLRPSPQTTQSTVVGAPDRPLVGLGNETALAPEPGVRDPANAALLQPGNQQPAVRAIPPVAFLPVTGAPQSTVTELAASMRSAAQSNAVPVVVSIQQGARYQVKGYFSALKDGNGTILVYVWDVLDANGTRVHRISGQERGGASNGDPWSGISESVINQVANNTMASLRSWISTRNAG